MIKLMKIEMIKNRVITDGFLFHFLFLFIFFFIFLPFRVSQPAISGRDGSVAAAAEALAAAAAAAAAVAHVVDGAGNKNSAIEL
jgi:hypothetical protein